MTYFIVAFIRTFWRVKLFFFEIYFWEKTPQKHYNLGKSLIYMTKMTKKKATIVGHCSFFANKLVKSRVIFPTINLQFDLSSRLVVPFLFLNRV